MGLPFHNGPALTAKSRRSCNADHGPVRKPLEAHINFPPVVSRQPGFDYGLGSECVFEPSSNLGSESVGSSDGLGRGWLLRGRLGWDFGGSLRGRLGRSLRWLGRGSLGWSLRRRLGRAFGGRRHGKVGEVDKIGKAGEEKRQQSKGEHLLGAQWRGRAVVWAPDEYNGFIECVTLEAFAPGQPGLVKLIKEQVETTLPAHLSKRVERRYVEGDSAPLDLATLPHLSQASILEATRVHHSNNQVYSSVGPILISVNPYQTIPELYSLEQHERYLDSASTASLPPHLYQIAAKAFRGATSNELSGKGGKNQSIVLSGESGGGKTMASRLLTEFLVFCSSTNSTKGGAVENQQSRVQHLLVQAVPLIESFGNAKTERNDNSSRFGCWTEINFANLAVCGAQLRAFNLEKSRVVSTAAGQRNFHIFYQFVSSLSQEEGARYRYLAGVESTATLQDQIAFEVTKTTMQQLGLDEKAMLQVLHGILELGNIEFHQVEEHAVISNPDQVVMACTKLGLDVTELSQSLVRRDMSNSKEIIYTPYSQSQAEGTRDALAKHLYGRLFDWVLASINTNMAAPTFQDDDQSHGYVGLLDMYGFEIFATNSLEQLCINYCNERIMESFNTKYIYDEAEFYRSEGISTNLDSIKRDRLVLDLLESNPTGIFNLLDEECKIPKGSDFGLLKRMRKQLTNIKFVPHIPQQENLFAITHFASTVRYNVLGFLEKNRDTLPSQIEVLCQNAVGLVGSDLFGQSGEVPALLTRQRSTSAFQKVSLSSRFRNDLRELMDKVERTETHFVRCIKPNSSDSPTEFHGAMVLAQLSYSGVLETCRLRQEHGYELRQTHEEFTRRQSRYFPSCSKDLELLDNRSTTVHTKSVLAMQAFARMAVEKKRHQQRKDFLVKLELALLRQPEPNYAVLDELVHGNEVKRLFPFQGQHLALVRRGHQVCQQLEQGWLLQLQAVEQAIANKDMVKLQLWLDMQSSYGNGSNVRLGEIVAKAKQTLRELKREEAAKVLQRAVRLFLFRTKVQRGFADLKMLHAKSKPEEIAPVIRRMAKLGLAKHPEVHRVKQFVPTTLQRPGRRSQNGDEDYDEEEAVEEGEQPALTKDLVDLGNLKLAVALARQKLQARTATSGDAITVRKEIDSAQSRGAVPSQLQDALQVETEVWAFVSCAKRRKLSWWQKLVSCGGCVPQTNNYATIPKTTREFV
ncbi:hypothetical protein BASA81_001893 [Batrachochytrium salamandrivorans]|nr:hypothetical protein BASA81_001893 [Batrachochytrium salamandrivorans]